MTTNNPPIAAWAPSTALAKLASRHNNSPCVLTDGPAEFNDAALVRLSDYQRLQADHERLQAETERLQAECEKLREFVERAKTLLEDPIAVFDNMKAGVIAKPSLRDLIDLHGDVPNGEDVQLLEIARLRSECEKLRKDAERYRWLRDGASMLTDLNPWEDVGFVGAVCVCTEYGSQTALTDEDLDAAIDAAMETTK